MYTPSLEAITLQWRHNGRDSVSNHQPHDCLLNRLFRRRSKKTPKPRITGLCVRGIHRWPVNSPQKRPITRKMFPLDDVIMIRHVLRLGGVPNLKHGPQSVFIAASNPVITINGHCLPRIIAWIEAHAFQARGLMGDNGTIYGYYRSPPLSPALFWPATCCKRCPGREQRNREYQGPMLITSFNLDYAMDM